MLETLDYTIRIGSIPTFLYFDLYLYSAYAAHFVYLNSGYVRLRNSGQIRVLESRRELHVYLLLIGVKFRSILDEF